MSRRNLVVETRTLASRIRIENGRAVGVDYIQDGQGRTAMSDREVILAGGVYGSPQLLMLSGVGDAEELQRHLLEYKLAREIAIHLRQREEAGLQTYGRSGLLAGIEAQLAWTPPTLLGLEVQSLALAFQRLLDLRAKEMGNGAELLPMVRISVGERISEIAGLLSERLSVLLSEVVENERSRLVIIVTFLAVLEMVRMQAVVVTQKDLFGEIALKRHHNFDDVFASEEPISAIEKDYI